MNYIKFFFLLLIITFYSCKIADSELDLIIINGKVIDGTGNPWFYGDIGMKNGRISRIGDLKSLHVRKIINAQDLYVTPGFIDVHTHADKKIDSLPDAINFIRQGVTSIVGGNCGKSRYPLKKLFADLKNQKLAVNFASYTGHNTIRNQVMAKEKRNPTNIELEQMKDLVYQEMAAGAIGLSTGLTYSPGRFSKTEEIIELAKVVHDFKGIYATHMRSEGKNIKSAIEEAIQICRKANVPLEISHIKLASEAVWGKYNIITDLVEKGRRSGHEIYLDQYPYTASSTGFTSSFPGWAIAGGHDSLMHRLKYPKKYRKIKEGIIKRRLTSSKGIDMLSKVYVATNRNHPEYEGKNLRQILELLERDISVSAAADLIIEMESTDQPRGIYFKMREEDVTALMSLPYTMIASDGGIKTVGIEKPHPRSYGTFPRILAKYVRKQNVISLSEAIRKMTSLPAQAMRFQNRGILRPGMAADIVIFDSNKINDNARYSSPHQYPDGIQWVIVNGKPIIESGKRTSLFPGKIIFGSGKN
jgi:N-acyl-D-amino-acid deacylase